MSTTLGNVVDVTVQTDVDGNYVFPDLRPSDAAGYTITETQPAGLLDGIDTAGSLGGDATTVNDVISGIVVAPGDAGTDYDFAELPPASLAGSVYEDLNNDGVFDAGEPGIAGVDVTLTGTDDLGNAVDVTVQTDVDGNYVFTDLRPADASGYTITETQPAGFLDGIDTAGTLGGDVTSTTLSWRFRWCRVMRAPATPLANCRRQPSPGSSTTTPTTTGSSMQVSSGLLASTSRSPESTISATSSM